MIIDRSRLTDDRSRLMDPALRLAERDALRERFSSNCSVMYVRLLRILDCTRCTRAVGELHPVRSDICDPERALMLSMQRLGGGTGNGSPDA
jgi:hypothetical protein